MSGSFQLNGKTALVTGASKGIGRATALELAAQGANLAVVARSGDLLESLAGEIHDSGSHCKPIVCDLADDDAADIISKSLSGRFESVDIVVNNAGIYKVDQMEDDAGRLADWRKTLDVNLTAGYRLLLRFASRMKERNWGRVVNISSVSGIKAEAYGAAYSASKFALLGLTQALALELAGHGVTVNAVCPGWVDTSLARKQLEDPEWCRLNQIEPQESIEIARLSIPQMRLIEPDEVAWLVAFLCSERAKGITGQAINICGGLSIT